MTNLGRRAAASEDVPDDQGRAVNVGLFGVVGGEMAAVIDAEALEHLGRRIPGLAQAIKTSHFFELWDFSN